MREPAWKGERPRKRFNIYRSFVFVRAVQTTKAIANGRPKTQTKPETMEDGLAFGIVYLSFRKLMSVNRLDLNIKCFIYQYFFSFFILYHSFGQTTAVTLFTPFIFTRKCISSQAEKYNLKKNIQKKKERIISFKRFHLQKRFAYNFTRYFC